MNLDIVKESLIASLQAISNIGFVEGTQGRIAGLPWEKDIIEPLWTVSVSGGRDRNDSDYPSTVSGYFHEHEFTISGYFPFSYESSSETIFDGYMQLIINKLSPKPSLDVCVETEIPALDTNDFVMYGAGDGAVLCHYCKIIFKCIEYVNLTSI